MGTGRACDEVMGFPDRHDNSKVQFDTRFLAIGTWNSSHEIGNIRLRPPVKVHVCVNRKGIPALFAHAFAFPVRLQGPTIDHELAGLAYGAFNAAKTLLNLFDAWTAHRIGSLVS